MKKIYITLMLILTYGMCLFAQDTLYVVKSGKIAFKQSVSEIDSITFVNSFNKNIIDKIALDENFSLFYKALVATGYADLIRETPYDDENYVPKIRYTDNILPKKVIPQSRKFGFTILMESDQTLGNYKECPLCPNGIKTLEDFDKLAEYFYSGSYKGIFYEKILITDRKDRRHHLNRYIAYHCMDRSLSSNRFINDYDTPNQLVQFDLYEFIETLLDNTLIKVKKDRELKQSNLMNMYNEEDSACAVRFTSKPGTLCHNGFYHEIDKPLAYTRDVVSNISTNRIRMDVSSFFKEFATNNFRGSNPGGSGSSNFSHDYDLPGNYCENLIFSDSTGVTYSNAYVFNEDLEGDRFVISGAYNLSITTPPIPPGTYEIRIGYNHSYYNGTTQITWDSLSCGEPVDFALLAMDNEIGWELPGSVAEDPFGYKNDSLMRTKGYMKAPASYRACFYEGYGLPLNARSSQYTLRRIIGAFTFIESGTHSLKLGLAGPRTDKNSFYLDYIEFVPIGMIENEGID